MFWEAFYQSGRVFCIRLKTKFQYFGSKLCIAPPLYSLMVWAWVPMGWWRWIVALVVSHEGWERERERERELDGLMRFNWMCHTLFISVCNFDMACSNCWCGMFGLKGVKQEFYTTSILNLNSYIYICVCVCVCVCLHMCICICIWKEQCFT